MENLYYEIQKDTYTGNYTISFSYGPEAMDDEGKISFDFFGTAIKLANDLGFNENYCEGVWASNKEVSEEEVIKKIKDEGFNPLPLNLLDREFVFYVVGVGG